MRRERSVTVDRGVVKVDGARQFLLGGRLSPSGRPVVDTAIDAPAAVAQFAAIGGNALVVDPADATAEVLEAAAELDVLVFAGPDEAQASHLPVLPLPRPLRLGWAAGDERDLPDLLRRRTLRPRRFVSGFGAPSVAAGDPLLGAGGWLRLGEPDGPPIDEDDLACLLHHTPPAVFDDGEAWALATRNYQAMVVRFHVEAARRLKYAPLGGLVVDVLCDHDGVSPSLLGPDGRPKEAFKALTAAFRPVLAIADRLPPHLHGDEALAIDLHVVNDRPAATKVGLVATLTWADGSQRYEFGGEVAGDAVRRLGTLSVVVPAVSGPLTLDVELLHDDERVTSTYRSDIFADPHDH